MVIFGQDKNSNSLHGHTTPLIEKGWVRALLLLLIYTSLSLVAGYVVWSPELWFSVSFILSFLLVFLFRKIIDKRSFESIGFNTNHLVPDALIGFAAGTFLVCTGALIIYLLNQIEWIDIAFNGGNLFISLGFLAMIALSEELVFRGYVLRNLMKSFNKWLALFISAVLFTMVHLTNSGIAPVGLLNTFLGGLVLGITFILTRTLWMPVFFHLGWNLVQGPVMGFQVSGLSFDSILSMDTGSNELITGGNYGFEGSITCTMLLIIASVAGCYLEHKKSSPSD